MFDYNKYKRMREIEDVAVFTLNNLFTFIYYNDKKMSLSNEDSVVNDVSNNLLHLNRLMLAYNQYGELSDVMYVLNKIKIKDICSLGIHSNAQKHHKFKYVIKELLRYMTTSMFRDMGLYLSNNQEENNHLNNELREEYRSVIYQLLEHI